MLTVRLHGHLEEKYGSEFKFQATSVREVIDALQANFDDFTEEFIKDQRAYNILVDAEAQEINGCIVPIKTDSTIDIIPIIGGAGFMKALGFIIIGALLLFPPTAAAIGGFLGGAGTMGSAFASVLGGGAAAGVIAGGGAAAVGAALAVGVQALAWGLVLAGVASLLAGPDGPDGGGPKSSGLSNTENIIGQGMPIPIGYGRLMVGSIVLSATFSSSYVQSSGSWTYEDTVAGVNKDFHLSFGEAQSTTTTAADDGYIFVPPYTYDGGYTPEKWTQINERAETTLGGGTFQIVNYTPTSGSVIPATQYTPIQISGSYSDADINHR